MSTPSPLLIALGLLFPASNDVEVTRFRAPEGPLAEHVSALHVTVDGLLWVGTRDGGVSSFDGTRWMHVPEEELGMSSVTSIFAGGEGVLWFSGPGGVARFDGQEWTHFGAEIGREFRVAFGGCVDTDGAVWFGTTVGAVRFDGETWEWTTTENGLKHDVVHDIHRDRTGNLWFATRRGGLSRLNGGAEGEWEHFLPNQNVRGIHEDADGNLWFGTGGGGVHQFDGERWTQHHSGRTVIPLFDARGNVWFSEAAGGVRRYRDGAWTLHEENMPGGEITAGCEGMQKELWFGATSGLNRLRKVK